MIEKRNCKVHGFTEFKQKENRKGYWWVCEKCLKLQWAKASAKRREKKDVQEYHKKYNKELSNIRKSLSVFLMMILLAANIKKPE
jgi:hypothetical protein